MTKIAILLLLQAALVFIAWPQTLTIPAGTEISIRTTGAIISKSADTFTEYRANVEEAVVVDGVVVVPANANAWLRVSKLQNAAFKKASMSTTLVGLIDRNGERVSVRTDSLASTAGSHARRTAATTGIGAGTGAAIGSVGGLAGAGIGAAAGAVAGGTTGVFMSKRDGVTIPSETRFSYRLEQAVAIAYQSPRVESSGGGETELPPALSRSAASQEKSSTVSRSVLGSGELRLGQTVAEVEAIMGKPVRSTSVGGKTIYEYKNLKVAFSDGIVTDVE